MTSKRFVGHENPSEWQEWAACAAMEVGARFREAEEDASVEAVERLFDACGRAARIEWAILDPELPDEERRRRARLPAVISLTRARRRCVGGHRGMLPGGESPLVYALRVMGGEDDPDPIWGDDPRLESEPWGTELLLERLTLQGRIRSELYAAVLSGRVSLPPFGSPQRELLAINIHVAAAQT